MSMTATQSVVTVSGIGLITGLDVQVTVELAEPSHGIVFYLEDGSTIPARFASAVHLDRGVTLAGPTGKTLSIVEHFMGATQFAGLNDLKVTVEGGPELPILDGSGAGWVDVFRAQGWMQPVTSEVELTQAVFYRHSDTCCVYAVPDTHFKLTYAMNFDHPDLNSQWARWDSRLDSMDQVVGAGTFGFLNELPVLQASGMARGASLENCLGLTDDGGYTRPLRYEQEPLHHKMLDLVGDLSLSGRNPLTLKAHVIAVNAGHSSHVPFGKKLFQAIPSSCPQPN